MPETATEKMGTNARWILTIVVIIGAWLWFYAQQSQTTVSAMELAKTAVIKADENERMIIKIDTKLEYLVKGVDEIKKGIQK